MINFKGKSSKEQGVKVRQIERNILPPVKENILTMPSVHGGLDFGRTYDVTTIDVTFGFTAKNDEELRKLIRFTAAWLNSSKLQPLILSDEEDKVYMARVSSETKLKPEHLYEEATVTFICPEGFASSTKSQKVDLVKGGTKQVYIEGTAETYPIFTIRMSAAASSFTITTKPSQEPDEATTLTIADSFKANDLIVVNCLDGSITLNGQLSNILTLESDFSILFNQRNDITCSNTGTVSMEYTDRWL